VGREGEEAGQTDLPETGALDENLGGRLGFDLDEGGGDGWTFRRAAVGPGEPGEQATTEVEGDEGFTGAGGGAEEGDKTARQPAAPEPLDGTDVDGDFLEAEERGPGRAGNDTFHLSEEFETVGVVGGCLEDEGGWMRSALTRREV
jgi:hypothetical protein